MSKSKTSEVWAFDANCLSQLLEMHLIQPERTVRFLGRHTLLTSDLVLHEITKGKKGPARREAMVSLSGQCDIRYCPINMVSLHEITTYHLNEDPLGPALSTLLFAVSPENCASVFSAVEEKFDKKLWHQSYIHKIQQDMDFFASDLYFSKHTDHGFQQYVLLLIAKLANETHRSPPVEKIHNLNFPFSYVYWYLYKQRYLVGGRSPETNDLFDLHLCSILPACDAYYGERSFKEMLRQIKGKTPMSNHQLFNHFRKMEVKDPHIQRVLAEPESRVAAPFLKRLKLHTVADLQRQIQGL